MWLWDHDPFGNGAPTGTFSYNLRFPGQFYDQNAKLHYNYYRDYDPNTGRYIESDPIGLAGGINTYAYVGGDPVGYIDPTGEGWYPYDENHGTPTSTGMYIFNRGGITYVYWNIVQFNNTGGRGYLGVVTTGTGPQTFRGIGGTELIWPSIGRDPNRPVAPRPRVPTPAFPGSGTDTYGDENGYPNGHLEVAPKVCPAKSTNDIQGQIKQPTPNVQNFSPTTTSSTSATGQPSTSNSPVQTVQSSLQGQIITPAAIPPGFAVAPVVTPPQK